MLFVFGVVPKMLDGFSDLPEQRQRMLALKSKRSEMVKSVAKAWLHTSLKKKVFIEADKDIKIGSHVLLYREIEKKWEGPYLVVAGDGKQLWILIKGKM